MSIIINRSGHLGFTLAGNTLNITNNSGTQDYLCGAYITTLTTISAGIGYPNGTTLNPSESYSCAILNIPPNSSIHKAYLVWTLSATTSDYTDDIELIASDGSKYSISPDSSDSYADFVLNICNISSQVSKHLSGTYTVGNFPGPNLKPNTSSVANSWYIAVVYESKNEPLRYITGKIELSPITVPTSEHVYKFFNFPGTATAGTPKQYYFNTSNLGNLYNGSSIIIGNTLPLSKTLGKISANKESSIYLNSTNIIPGNILNCDINDVSFQQLDTRGTFGTYNKDITPGASSVPYARTNFNMFGVDVSNILSINEQNLYVNILSNETTNYKCIFNTGHYYLTDIVYSDLSSSTLSVDKPFVTLGDTLTYTISLTNTGNGNDAKDVSIINELPKGTSFIPGSVLINGVQILNSSPDLITIDKITTNEVVSISFDVELTNIIDSNTLNNTTIISYRYKPLTNLQYETFKLSLNALSTINSVQLISSNNVNKQYSFVGDTLTYTIPITNIGTTATKTLFLSDTIPTGTSFVYGSLIQDSKILDDTLTDYGFALNNIEPNTTTTVSFDILIESLPTPNSISNSATCNFSYIINPTLNAELIGYGVSNTNITSTTVSSAKLLVNKIADKEYVGLDDIVNYSITIKNIGNTPTHSISLYDFLPSYLSFIKNSLFQDMIAMNNIKSNTEILLKNIEPNSVSTLTYSVIITSIPPSGSIESYSKFKYDYVIDPSKTPNILSTNSVFPNSSLITVNYVELLTENPICNSFADVAHILTYTIPITNKGNAPTNSIILIDTIPAEARFIDNSLVQDNIAILGNPNPPGVNLNQLSPNTTSTITFKVIIDKIPADNTLKNSATINFDYLIDPLNNILGNNSINTSIAITTISAADINVTESVDRLYADIKDIITYTLLINNTGNIATNNLLLIDTVPNGLSFINNSIIQDNVA
ncbi:MAG: hypothetical protein ACRC5M_01310, partial [Anaeroplasmataceae bacterium]